ncbi:MAG: hypothetical protein FWF88_07090, partial [Peptococcaceae bacterium]|nr:hypothetical protein [Peptococcaceae bacterium]
MMRTMLFKLSIALLLSIHCFAPDVYAADNDPNMIPNGNFEVSVPRSLDGTGSNILTLETGSANLNTNDNINNNTTALRVKQQDKNAFVAFPISLERGKTYNYRFDILVLEDNLENTELNNLKVPPVFRFGDPSYGSDNHFTGEKLVNSGMWTSVTGSYTAMRSVLNNTPLPDNATPEYAHFVIYVATPGTNLLTYLIDNVELIESGTNENLIPNGKFEESVPQS